MILRWINTVNVVDWSTFTPGKSLLMEVSDAPEGPGNLQVFQIYSSAMRQVLKHIGVPERRALSEFPTKPVGTDKQMWRADKLWRLPEPRGLRKSASFRFEDSTGQHSGLVHSSRIGKAKLKTEGGLTIPVPTGFTTIGLHGRAGIEVELLLAADPQFSVEVLTGQGLADHMLSNLIDDVGWVEEGEPNDVRARIELGLDELRASLPFAYSPPDDWNFELSESDVAGDQGDVLQLTLRLEASSQGQAYIAVTFIDQADTTLGETTDVWAVTVDAELTVSITSDTYGLPLPSLAVALG